MRSALCGFALMVACTGGGGGDPGPDAGPDANPTSVMLSIPDGAVIGGVHDVSVAAADPEGIVRIELYLDGNRIAELPFAPFVHDWDTRPFPEGTHELTARAYTSDARIGLQTISIAIDNTAPTVGELPEGVAVGVPIDLPVADNIGIARVEVAFGGGAPTQTITAAPWQATFQSCTPAIPITVTVVDHAGWRGTGQASVYAIDGDDVDCDHARASQGDCDDNNPRVHPGAPDGGDSFRDLDCDGVAGHDGDHDGVASVGTGGTDCNDDDPAIHGPAFRWQRTSVPGTSPPYGLMMAVDGATAHLLSSDAWGSLRYRAASAVTYEGTDEMVTEDSDDRPAAVVVRNGRPDLFFVRGTGELYHAGRDPQGGGGWRFTRVDSESGWNASNIVVRVDAAGELHAAWGSSSGVRYARTLSGAWSSPVTLATAWNPAVDLVVEPDGTRRVLFAAGAPGEVVALPGQAFGAVAWLSSPADRDIYGLVAMPGTNDVYLNGSSSTGGPPGLFRVTRMGSGWSPASAELATLGYGTGELRALPGHLFQKTYNSGLGEETTHHLAVIDRQVMPATLVEGSLGSALVNAGAPAVSSSRGVARLTQTIPWVGCPLQAP